MVLRVPNTATTELVALSALRQVIVPNTQLALGSSDGTGLVQVYINSAYLLSTGSFPAVHLSSSGVVYRPRGAARMGEARLYVDYYDRWDTQPSTLDTLFTAISLDLERMKANVESNDMLVVGTSVALESLLQILLSPYAREVDRTFPGLALATRRLTLVCILPEYTF